jgi:protein-tyrosine-phosphatase
MGAVDEELWQDFHTVVNMSSRELADWLRADSAGETTEEVPDRAGADLGRQVLAILGKRRVDLTDDDVAAMTSVVDMVRRERRADLEPTAGDDDWRHRLMSVGHDPLKRPRAS